MNRIARSDRESGQVAIISVMFFMILFSVVTVSFVQAVVSEQRQTTNNELSASALSAAEAGVEDAKRVIGYCMANPSASGCASIYNPTTTDCAAIINSALPAALSITTATDEAGAKQAVVDATNKQYYTCMIINYLTATYENTATADGKSIIVPLKLSTYNTSTGTSTAATSAAYFTVKWHSNSASGNGTMTGTNTATNLPTSPVWKAIGNFPAVLRVELITVPSSGTFTLDTITNSARAVTLRPVTSSTSGGSSIATVRTGYNAYNMNYWAQNTEPNGSTVNPIMYVNCSSTNAYACSLDFTLNNTTPGSLSLSSNNYYLRIQAIYNDADIQVSAVGPSGETLYLNGVQPSIDVTGRAIDAYRRLSSRVEARSSNDDYSWWPEYALQSGNAICKNMTVDSDTGTDNCTY